MTSTSSLSKPTKGGQQSSSTSDSTAVSTAATCASLFPTAVQHYSWMQTERVWPHCLRYLWTDAHGVLALLAFYNESGEEKYLQQALWVVKEVKRVLGRSPGYRIGEEEDRWGQYYHYLTKWLYLLSQLRRYHSAFDEEAVALIKSIHPKFYAPSRGMWWKMSEDLSRPVAGIGGLDCYDGYVMYRLIDQGRGLLTSQIADMKKLVDESYPHFSCHQDLGLGEVLWLCHFFPEEKWAKHLRAIAIKTLDAMWTVVDDSRGYWKRDYSQRSSKEILAFSNYGVCYGCRAQGIWEERVLKALKFFESFRSGDDYDLKSITHVMRLNALFPAFFLKVYPIKHMPKETLQNMLSDVEGYSAAAQKKQTQHTAHTSQGSSRTDANGNEGKREGDMKKEKEKQTG